MKTSPYGKLKDFLNGFRVQADLVEAQDDTEEDLRKQRMETIGWPQRCMAENCVRDQNPWRVVVPVEEEIVTLYNYFHYMDPTRKS